MSGDNLQMFLQLVEVDNSAAIVVQFIFVLCFRYHPLGVPSSECMGPFQVFIVSHATLNVYMFIVYVIKLFIQGTWIPDEVRKVNNCSVIKD